MGLFMYQACSMLEGPHRALGSHAFVHGVTQLKHPARHWSLIRFPPAVLNSPEPGPVTDTAFKQMGCSAHPCWLITCCSLLLASTLKGSPFTVTVRKRHRPHPGVFHCCTFCSSGGQKTARCACGGTMPGEEEHSRKSRGSAGSTTTQPLGLGDSDLGSLARNIIHAYQYTTVLKVCLKLLCSEKWNNKL